MCFCAAYDAPIANPSVPMRMRRVRKLIQGTRKRFHFSPKYPRTGEVVHAIGGQVEQSEGLAREMIVVMLCVRAARCLAMAVTVTPRLVKGPDHHVRDEEGCEAQQHPQAGRLAVGARVGERVQEDVSQQTAGGHRLSQRHELGRPSLPGRVVRKQKQDQVRGQADQARRQQGRDGRIREEGARCRCRVAS
jgi:hypothetical protein